VTGLNRRVVIVAAAVIFAVIAFIGNLLYLKSADNRAAKDARLVDVYTIKVAIPKGTAGENVVGEKMVVIEKVPESVKPQGAITNLDVLRKKVAVSNLAAGQLLVEGQFASAASAQSTFTQRIPKDQVAVSISVDQVHAVAGFVQPGDKVNVLVYGKDPSSKDGRQVVRVLYQGVNVLAVGATPALQPGESQADIKNDSSKTPTPAPASLITLAVPLDAAERIVLPASGAEGSIIYLTLVSPDSAATTQQPPTFDLKNALESASITPYK
jgi:pilus assembly protein CpaB